MPTLAQSMPSLPFPAFAGMASKTYAAWPVWSGSVRKEIKFQPLPKKQALKIWHRARAFDRQTRKEGHHGGALGHAALQVLHTLIFDFLNYASGRLDPSHAAIARAANVCERTVRNALNRLRERGILNWVRRCAESRKDDGRYVLEQETNAYAVLPDTQWRGYIPPPEPPRPDAGTWGDHPPMPTAHDQAILEQRTGGALRTVLSALESDPTDMLAKALASFGRSMESRKTL